MIDVEKIEKLRAFQTKLVVNSPDACCLNTLIENLTNPDTFKSLNKLQKTIFLSLHCFYNEELNNYLVDEIEPLLSQWLKNTKMQLKEEAGKIFYSLFSDITTYSDDNISRLHTQYNQLINNDYCGKSDIYSFLIPLIKKTPLKDLPEKRKAILHGYRPVRFDAGEFTLTEEQRRQCNYLFECGRKKVERASR